MHAYLRALVIGLAVVSYSGHVRAQDSSPAQPSSETSVAPAEWLLGDWVFDEEYTQKKQAETKKKEPNLTDVAGALVTSQLITKLQGSKITVTKQEFTMAGKDGNGKSMRYTTLKGPDANSTQLKGDNGEVLGFHRDGERIWMNSTGSVNEPFYFKRAK